MADVTINIRQTNGSSIVVSGIVDEAALAPFTLQLSTLLSAAVNASATPPASTPTTTDTPTSSTTSVAAKRRKTGE